MSGISTKGINETLKMLENIQSNTDDIMEKALKEGIGIVTDEMRREISSIQTANSEHPSSNGKRYPSKKEVKGLLDSLGYTPTKLKGTKFDVKAGFDGYNNVITKKYPLGHANQMIANSINKGTSFMKAQPFINRTKKKSQQQAVDTIERIILEEISKLSK